jgi:hypothetical protein
MGKPVLRLTGLIVLLSLFFSPLSTYADHIDCTRRPTHPHCQSTPTTTPTAVPTATALPTETPLPTATMIPTEVPTAVPTEAPTATTVPTETPTTVVTETPTETVTPTETPTTEASPVASPAGSPTAVPAGEPRVEDLPVIVKEYTFNPKYGGANYNEVRYMPRQFNNGLKLFDYRWGGNTTLVDVGPYAKFDVLPMIGKDSAGVSDAADFARITVNRPTTVIIVWRDGRMPTWPTTWEEGPKIKAHSDTWGAAEYRTFKKVFTGGEVVLGGYYNVGEAPFNTRDAYWVLFAEADGNPPSIPTVPNGAATPQPNQTCPAWVHDQYVAVGPDGQTYRTWHSQIDPRYWCYFGHEHGSNPAYFHADYKPLYGYSASKHPNMEEAHNGFKSLHVVSGGYNWFWTIHMGSSGTKRICTEHHTLDLAVAQNGTIVADLHSMASFGQSVLNFNISQPITPAECPDQGVSYLNRTNGVPYGQKQIPAPDPARNGQIIGYEPWRPDLTKTVLGWHERPMLVNNTDPMLVCNDHYCAQPITTGNKGTARFYQGFDFRLRSGIQNSGVFYTNPEATAFTAADDPMALRQYLAAGLSAATADDMCADHLGWGKPFTCPASTAVANERENSIVFGN